MPESTSSPADDPSPSESESESPCINVCAIGISGVCLGCHRTLDEIAVYSQLTSDQRRAVNLRAIERGKCDGSDT
ncbi:DUF1289 domain-containing protein [Rubripirellula reticaptiva]|uniref:DUF1289 domain-containing protein n=1 Tax=Rubripirellula reticaptiva TaxID=2528013 RepID=UPI0011B70BD6|nr:DUF1289 domain-containing protein [Rubripirellula reticaptiva]